DRQPPPRPPQSTIPQLTSLLINNAGALVAVRRQPPTPSSPGAFSPNAAFSAAGRFLAVLTGSH
ncbi:hypothetical protein, partial [Mycobacterium pseudoshottsii]|uniref:hypothetical protein n=1 Tax=Mycobacterium pseudoshottsii TaxID=265949 RepID=UPI003F762204